MVWPIHSQSKWERVSYVPNCVEVGSHRFGQVHLYPFDKSVQFRVCKRCGIKEYVKLEFKDGKMIETVLVIERNETKASE